MSTVWELCEASFGKSSEQIGNVYLEMAKVHNKNKDIQEAIKAQTSALETFEALEKFAGSDYLASIATVLSEWQEKVNDVEGALNNLKKAQAIYEQNYTSEDKRTCKVRRHIALIYLKNNYHDEAL